MYSSMRRPRFGEVHADSPVLLGQLAHTDAELDPSVESTSRVATDLAKTTGWCSGRTTTLVPRWIVLVAAATKASHTIGSGMPPRRHSRSIVPSGDPR